MYQKATSRRSSMGRKLFPEISRYSFWKPHPIPTEGVIAPVDLVPLGPMSVVANKLMEVSGIIRCPVLPWLSSISMFWESNVGRVSLGIRPEQGPPKPGEVIMISVQSAVPARAFYLLYVQVFEQLDVILLDEQAHRFVSPVEFRKKL